MCMCMWVYEATRAVMGGGGGTTRFLDSLSGTSEATKTPLSGEHW